MCAVPLSPNLFYLNRVYISYLLIPASRISSKLYLTYPVPVTAFSQCDESYDELTSPTLYTHVRKYIYIHVTPQYDEWQEELARRWQAVHNIFAAVAPNTPNAVTMDHKIFFRTIIDANRYSALLRKLVNKCSSFLDRKRKLFLRWYLQVLL